MFSIFSRNSESIASEFPENHEGIISRYHIHSGAYIMFKSSTTPVMLVQLEKSIHSCLNNIQNLCYQQMYTYHKTTLYKVQQYPVVTCSQSYHQWYQRYLYTVTSKLPAFQ